MSKIDHNEARVLADIWTLTPSGPRRSPIADDARNLAAAYLDLAAKAEAYLNGMSGLVTLDNEQGRRLTALRSCLPKARTK